MQGWLKWTLISIGAVLSLLTLMIAGLAFLFFVPSAPEVEAVSDQWVLVHYYPSNPDGRHASYLARRSAGGNKEVSGKILEHRYVGDDCVIYTDWDYGLFGVCGESAPVYVDTIGSSILREQAVSLKADPIVVGKKRFSVGEVKRAAQLVSEENPGGEWWVQRQAFPDSQGGPYYILFHAERHRRRFPMPVLAFRYLGDDCLLYVDLPVMRMLLDPAILGSGEYPITAACGRRYETHLGTVERPSDIAMGDAVLINGRSTPVSEILKRALAERERR
jgi:hypothetical protein